MNRLAKAIMTISVIILCGISFGNTTLAKTIDGLKEKQSEVKDERSELKKDLNKANAEIADVLFDLKEINEEIALVDKALKQNKVMVKEVEQIIEQTEEEINVLQDEITVLKNDIEIRNNILKQRLTTLQKNGGSIGYLDVLFGAESFMDFIGRASTITKITNSDMDLIDKQEEDKELVAQKLEKVEGKLVEQEENKIELEGMQLLIVDQQEENDNKKKTLQKKEKKIKKMKSKLEDKDKSLASIEAKIRKDIVAARAPKKVASNKPSNSSDGKAQGGNVVQLGSSNKSGKLGWPTVGGYISSYMGPRGGRYHNGIDIARTDYSTTPPIYAADEGTVESVGFHPSFGNNITINHHNGMKTLYAHLSSINVSSGQKVSKGTKLGMMGRTGNATGVHLHFEVRVNGALQNPTKYFNY